jgi:hypothetical protein
MSDSERNHTLTQINAALIERNLKPLTKLGDFTKGEFQIVAIDTFHDHSKDYFTDVKFIVLLPKSGKTGAFTIRFNAKGLHSDGAVVSVIINGKFAIVKQWRPALGRYSHELPRGFGQTLETARDNGTLGKLAMDDLPLATLNRELGADVMESAKVVSVAFLGNVAENSGTHAVTPSHFLIQLAVDPGKLASRLKSAEDGLALQLWSVQTLRAELGAKLCDNHSITGAALALAHLTNLPR